MRTENFWLLSFVQDFSTRGLPGNRPYVTEGALRQEVLEQCRTLQNLAQAGDRAALDYLHRVVAAIYDYRFSVPDADTVEIDVAPLFADITSLFEPLMLDTEVRSVTQDTLSAIPQDGAQFLEWLKTTMSEHPAGVHRFYREFLRDHADTESVRTFLAQETTLDPRFDDILALLQIGTSGSEKMEIAKNYYDEMGCGEDSGVHSYLFSKALRALDIDAAYIERALLPDSRISGNLSACLALSPRYHYKALGYFGVTEYLAPRRFKDLVAGWRRLGLPAEGIEYHDLHIRIDAVHGKAWLDNVIRPLIERDPRVAKEIALGAMIRLNSSARYLDTLQATLTQRQYSHAPQLAASAV